MNELLSLTRAARLVGVPRTELQKKIQNGDMVSHDGMVAVTSLLSCYPEAQLEDNAELRRISQIKEKAFGKRVAERVLPDSEVLAARIAEQSKALAINQKQLGQFVALIGKLWDKLDEIERADHLSSAYIKELKKWIRLEVDKAMEPGHSNPLALKDSILQVMTAQVTLMPSQQDFLVEGQDTLLEAAMRSGISLNYGCSGGNCGLCKAKVISGQVKQTRHHDFVISDTEKQEGYVLLCSNTAISDLTIEASVACGVQDIPYQQLTTRVKQLDLMSDKVMLLHLQTPRAQRLRFLAGQRATLHVGQAYTAELPIASCPCDDRNLLFHIHRQPGNLFSDYVFNQLKPHDAVELEGPQGEFILHEKSARPLYFIAFDGGFAPVKSLIEHALSLETESIHLIWICSDKEHLYLPNVGRAWTDALDNLSYSEKIAGFNLRAITGKREKSLLELLANIASNDAEVMRGDIYIAGPGAAVEIAERFFLEKGLPKTRVFAEKIK